MKGPVTMSIKEADRIAVLEKLVRKEIKQKKAALQLSLSARQVRRLVKRYERKGALGLVHQNRGRTSNNKTAVEAIDQAMKLIQAHYHDFGPTLAHEKLSKLHGIGFSVERLRQVMIEHGFWKPKTRRRVRTHQLRLRRAALGELIQVDGSPHFWFEDRGPYCTLIAFIDDATGRIMAALFVKAETTWAYFQATKDYLTLHGKMVTVYVDKHSVFRVNTSKNGSAFISDSNGLTQYGRALRQLKIEIIYAHSPQAKGRIERLFETLQDRLVKEMRLKGINTIADANAFLPEFIGGFNQQFGVVPRSRADMHRPLSKLDDLSKILTIQTTRTLSKNLTCQYQNLTYQVQSQRPSYALRQAKVLVREYQDGRVDLEYQGKRLGYTVINKQAKTMMADSKLVSAAVDNIIKKQAKLPWKPAADHPWKRTYITS